MSIPTELEDAAKIDGATPMQYFRKILIPLSGPMIAGGASIINFVYAWNMYLWPLIVTMDNKMKTVQIGVKMLIATDSTNNWGGIIMAGTLMAALPTLILFFLYFKIYLLRV